MDKVIIKTPEEIEKMRELGRLVAEALDYIGQFVKPGVTTNEIDKLVYDYHVNVQGGYPAPLNYGNLLHLRQPRYLPRHSRRQTAERRRHRQHRPDH